MTVFRLFHDRETLGQFLTGAWTGVGIHGSPDLPSDMPIYLNLKIANDTLFVVARKQKPRGTESFRDSHDISNASLMSPDLVEYQSELGRLTIQAMDQSRIHLLLYSNHGRVVFAGALKRLGGIQKLFYRF